MAPGHLLTTRKVEVADSVAHVVSMEDAAGLETMQLVLVFSREAVNLIYRNSLTVTKGEGVVGYGAAVGIPY